MGKKTLWEKEKLLVTSNFSFSHSVLKKLALQTGKKQGLLRERVIWMDGWWMDGWMKGWMDPWKDEWMDPWMD